MRFQVCATGTNEDAPHPVTTWGELVAVLFGCADADTFLQLLEQYEREEDDLLNDGWLPDGSYSLRP